MSLRFLDKKGNGYESNAIAALYYAIENGATISNHSWGGASYSSGLVEVLAYAKAHGLLRREYWVH